MRIPGQSLIRLLLFRYFVISGEKLGINSSDYEKFFKLIDNNINISTNKTYKTVGLLLSDDKKKIVINNSTTLDLVTNVNIILLVLKKYLKILMTIVNLLKRMDIFNINIKILKYI